MNSVASLVSKSNSSLNQRDSAKWNVLKSTLHQTLRKGKQTELQALRKGQLENQLLVKRFVLL